MTRRIVFAGGTQARALARAYRLDAAGARDEDVFFIGAETVAREAARRVIAAADVVVTEVDEQGAAVPDGLVPSRAVLVSVPVVCADFLWPFAGRPHPANPQPDCLPDGPYPADFGDSHLDGLLAQGVAPEEAVRRYVEADLARLVDLDGMLAGFLRRQAALDARTGYELAPLVERQFRERSLFASRHGMREALFGPVAAKVFAGISAEPAGGLAAPHASTGEMPVHPSVLRHFGMQAPAPDHRYAVLDEGCFTFEEYCHRYMRCAWNEGLHRALALADTDPGQAIGALRLALADSPGSRAGQAALARAEKVFDRSMPRPDSVSAITPASLAGAAAPPGQGFLELPLAYDGHANAAGGGDRAGADRSADLIEVLPRMLAGTRAAAGADERPFAIMEEAMPPPPSVPVLPPEERAGAARRGLLARLFGGAS